MAVRVNIELHRVASAAPGRARLIGRSIGHHDSDFVIFGMNFGFHYILQRGRGLYTSFAVFCKHFGTRNFAD